MLRCSGLAICKGVQRMPRTLALLSMWDRSAPTPSVPTMSYRLSSPMEGEPLSSSARGWPMPPAAPVKRHRSWVSRQLPCAQQREWS